MGSPDKFVVSFNSSYAFCQTLVRFESARDICRTRPFLRIGWHVAAVKLCP